MTIRLSCLSTAIFWLLLATTLGGMSCNGDGRAGRAIRSEAIAQLPPGATYQDVTNRFGPQLADVPWLIYPAEGGGYYVFLFIGFPEGSAEGSSDKPAVTAVIKTENRQTLQPGTYIYPPEMKGKPFRGLFADTRPARK